MATYFVEGQLIVCIDCEIEANSLEEAEQKAFEMYKEDHPMLNYVTDIRNDGGLMAGEFEDEEYGVVESEDEDEDE